MNYHHITYNSEIIKYAVYTIGIQLSTFYMWNADKPLKFTYVGVFL